MVCTPWRVHTPHVWTHMRKSSHVVNCVATPWPVDGSTHMDTYMSSCVEASCEDTCVSTCVSTPVHLHNCTSTPTGVSSCVEGVSGVGTYVGTHTSTKVSISISLKSGLRSAYPVLCFFDNYAKFTKIVSFIYTSWRPAALLLTSWQRGGEQGIYFGHRSRLPAGLHQAFGLVLAPSCHLT